MKRKLRNQGMKFKAQGNIDVSQQLINMKDTQFCTASVHCSYYAVFQYMKYMLAKTDRNPISYQLQDEQCKNKTSSHDYLLIEIQNRILDSRNGRDFAQHVRSLKRERVEADYKSRMFTLEESLDCKQKAEGLITKLKTYFGNI